MSELNICCELCAVERTFKEIENLKDFCGSGEQKLLDGIAQLQNTKVANGSKAQTKLLT